MTAPFTPLIPRQPVPDISVPTVGGETWTLSQHDAKTFTMVVVYRGLHCPICKTYLNDLQSHLDSFAEQGVQAIAISSDDADRAAQAKSDWGLEKLNIGHSLALADGRKLGLYISSSRGKTSVGIEEPDLFFEPGLFLIKPDQTLYYASVQTMPFARPSFADLARAVTFAVEKDYPARGHVMEIPGA